MNDRNNCINFKTLVDEMDLWKSFTQFLYGFDVLKLTELALAVTLHVAH